MARYLVHLVVQNDVITKTPLGGASVVDNQWLRYHKVFRHNKLSKAVETFKKCVISEQARWGEFNKVTNDEHNSACVRIKQKDESGVFKYFYEISGLGYIMHGSPECISRIWIEDISNFKQKNSVEKRKQVEKQMSLNFSHDLWEKAQRNMNKKPNQTFKEHMDKIRRVNEMDEIPFT